MDIVQRFIWATSEGHCDIIVELLSSKANVNAKKSDGCTSLHLAAFRGCKVAVKMLLISGAIVNILNKDNLTPLILAVREWHCEVIEELLNSKTESKAKTSQEITLSQLASKTVYKDAVKMRLINGADVTITNNKNWTALHWAASKAHCEVIEELLKYNVDINAMDSNGDTHDAAYYGNKDAVKMLLKGGANAKKINNENACRKRC